MLPVTPPVGDSRAGSVQTAWISRNLQTITTNIWGPCEIGCTCSTTVCFTDLSTGKLKSFAVLHARSHFYQMNGPTWRTLTKVSIFYKWNNIKQQQKPKSSQLFMSIKHMDQHRRSRQCLNRPRKETHLRTSSNAVRPRHHQVTQNSKRQRCSRVDLDLSPPRTSSGQKV